jgi:cold shock CspA family protein
MTPAVLIHVTALRGIDPDNLRVGERLTFDVERDARSGKIKAANVRRPG